MLPLSETSARRYLISHCWRNFRRFCPRCREKKIYRLADGRYRCKKCNYTFHDFTGRWLNRSNLLSVQWMNLIHHFAHEMTVRQIAQCLSVSYNTVYKAITSIRLAIVAHSDDYDKWFGHLELEKNSKALGTWKSEAGSEFPPVLGIRKTDKHVHIEPVPDMTWRDVLARNVKKIRRDKLVYTDPVGDFDSLVFYGYEPEIEANIADVVFAKNRYHRELHDFWRFAVLRLRAGISPDKFPLYLKEIEFRYNNKDEVDFEEKIILFMCDFVSNAADVPIG